MSNPYGTARSIAIQAMVLIFVQASPVRAADDLRLVAAPESVLVSPGDTVTVTLEVAGLSVAINGVQALLRYDNTILSLEDIVPTTLALTDPAEGWVTVHFSDVGGDVTWAAVINGDSTAADGVAATLTFTAIDEGVTSVTFRPDEDPFFTKLTAFDNTTIFPLLTDSDLITSTCDDGFFCNGEETFTDGACQPGEPPDCGALSDECNQVACNEDIDGCEATPVNEGGACDDGDLCTINSVCVAGVCTGEPVDCSGLDDPCNEGICNPDTGECEASAINEGGSCDDGVFCNGTETCIAGECISSGDPCDPLQCIESEAACVAPLKIEGLDVFYAGRFLTCHGGTADGAICTSSDDCGGGVCRELADPDRSFLGTGGTATVSNITNYVRGITGIRIFFNQPVEFAAAPADAFSFEWTTGTGSEFTPVTDAETAVTITTLNEGTGTVVSLRLAADHVRRRWLKVTLDASQVSASGVSLDGELSGNPAALPSGDGIPGGDAEFYVGNMPGEVNGDRTTTLADVGAIRGVVNPFLAVPITNVFDVDKDGRVRLSDVGSARANVNPFITLTLIAP